jgi:hypothetical protein
MRAIARFGNRQHGLVTTEQVLASSTRHELNHLVATGRLEPVRRGVYRCAGAPETWHQHLLSACLAAGGNAAASFRAAATLWDLPDFDRDRLEITVPGRLNPRLADVVVHQTNVWGPRHTAVRHAIPTTSVARTLCDLTAVVWPWRVVRLVNDAERRGIVSLRQLLRVFQDLENRGRRRSTVMRAVLADRLEGIRPGGSEREVDVAKLLLRARLPELSSSIGSGSAVGFSASTSPTRPSRSRSSTTDGSRTGPDSRSTPTAPETTSSRSEGGSSCGSRHGGPGVRSSTPCVPRSRHARHLNLTS